MASKFKRVAIWESLEKCSLTDQRGHAGQEGDKGPDLTIKQETTKVAEGGFEDGLFHLCCDFWGEEELVVVGSQKEGPQEAAQVQHQDLDERVDGLGLGIFLLIKVIHGCQRCWRHQPRVWHVVWQQIALGLAHAAAWIGLPELLEGRRGCSPPSASYGQSCHLPGGPGPVVVMPSIERHSPWRSQRGSGCPKR